MMKLTAISALLILLVACSGTNVKDVFYVDGEPYVSVSITKTGASDAVAENARKQARDECLKIMQPTAGPLLEPQAWDFIVQTILEELKSEGKWSGPCKLLVR